MKLLHVASISAALALTQACSHPLEIVGEGDITSASGSRNCTLEDYAAELDNCSENLVIGNYTENYIAIPRAGWSFDRWTNYCVDVEINECSFNVSAELTNLFWGETAPPLEAVFSKHKVTGPILPNAGIALGSGPENLTALGYEKVEYFIEGNAHSYTPELPLPTDGKLIVTADPYDSAGDYKTRVVVNRPIDSAAFNGTVIVEWLNVTAGADTPPDWIMAHNEFIRNGYIWIGVSAQAVGVNTIKSGSAAARYMSLLHPGDSYSYNIFSHVGLRASEPASAFLAGLTAERVLAAGESQSAGRMVTYIDAVHPIEEVYDGFLVHSRFGSGSSIAQSPLPSYSFPSPAPIRNDLNVPVMVVEAEGDVIGSNLGARQPDTPMFRGWEIAGTAHVDAYTLVGLNDPGDGSAAITMFDYLRAPPNPFGCDNAINAGPHYLVVPAAFRALDTWVRTLNDPSLPVIAPPQGTPLTVLSSSPVVLDRDVHGIALGGIRSPHVNTPLALLDSANSGIFFCRLFGRTEPFSVSKVVSLYPTKADFLTEWLDELNTSVTDGFILPEDAVDLEAAANAWDFPN